VRKKPFERNRQPQGHLGDSKSRQGDIGNVGPDCYDQAIVRGTPERGTFTAFWLRARS
jgi:hypothetical protein